ncbi:MAG: Zn-dependent oligopeptidase [Pseudomonadales bacterium]|nr:Zn-dependent oligopeptidase [Pseudomonadales bacterium]
MTARIELEMTMIRIFALTLTVIMTSCQTANEGNPPGAIGMVSTPVAAVLIDGFAPNTPPDELTAICNRNVEQATSAFQALETDTSPATLDSVIGGFDRSSATIEDLVHTFHLKAVHPNAAIRDAATACSLKIEDFVTMTGLSRGYYDRLVAIDQTHLSPTEQYMLTKVIRTYELAGVSRGQAEREKLRALQKEITAIGNTFGKNIREDVRYVETTLKGLSGLPEDYINNHPADESGTIKISTDYPDLYPVMTYAHNDDLRQRLRVAARARGYPVNKPILKELITKRRELAELLGFETFAELSMKDKMIEHPERAAQFLTSLREALQEPLVRETAIYLNRLREIDPDAEVVQVWQASYLSNLLRQEDYALDSKLVRTYFTYERVRAGIFGLTEDLFGVTIEPWTTETWHEDVETFQVVENGQVIGRFYMDNHPRPNKYKHAAHWTIRTGIKDQQIPLSALAQNFPKGLMEHSQVETFLHEFGHLIHNMFSGTQTWSALAGMSMERDFVEAPSQMLEEWIWDYDTLKKFALNERGEVIPEILVEKMNRARNFGQASATATQIYYARLSLDYYTRPPESFDLDELMLDLGAKYSPYPHVEGTHFYANFGHLYGYSSNYYTYQWSLAIATDLFSRFQEEGLRNTQTATEYRHRILGAAGSKPADEFVEDFLGREFSAAAYIDWLRSL